MERELLKKAFQIKKSPVEVCLLIHGFCGTPSEMRFLAQALAQRGYSVSGMLLAGHGGTPEDMIRHTCQDWIDCVVEEYGRLRLEYQRVHVIGQSMGALLALYLAQHEMPDTVTALAPALRLADPRAKLAAAVRYVMPYREWEKLVLPEETRPYLCSCRRMPMASLAQLNQLAWRVERSLEKVRCPALFAYGIHDTVIDHHGVGIAYGRISSEEKKKMVLPHSAHVVTLDQDRQKLFRGIIYFLEEH